MQGLDCRADGVTLQNRVSSARVSKNLPYVLVHCPGKKLQYSNQLRHPGAFSEGLGRNHVEQPEMRPFIFLIVSMVFFFFFLVHLHYFMNLFYLIFMYFYKNSNNELETSKIIICFTYE